LPPSEPLPDAAGVEGPVLAPPDVEDVPEPEREFEPEPDPDADPDPDPLPLFWLGVLGCCGVTLLGPRYWPPCANKGCSRVAKQSKRVAKGACDGM
jgi:hypothetical protein